MNWRMCLIIRITNFRIEKLILINEFLDVILILIVGPEPFNKAFQVHGFGERVGLGPGITDITFGIKMFGDFHDSS